jgi:hypothetical protein
MKNMPSNKKRKAPPKKKAKAAAVKGTASLRTKLEEITPKKATQWLAKNTMNRKVRKRVVERYAGQMRDGEWKITGEAIQFSKEGVLLNGQHRLLACIEANVPFTTLVVHGVGEAARPYYDTGTARQARDALSMNGVAYAGNLASAIRTIKGIESVEEDGAPLARIRWAKYTSHAEVLSFAKEHEARLVRGAELTTSRDARLVCAPASLFTALYFIFAESNELRAEEFFEALIGGENLNKSNPIWHLRTALTRARPQLGKRTTKTNIPYKAAITAKAWNAWMAGKVVKTLRHGENEKWPKILRRKK